MIRANKLKKRSKSIIISIIIPVHNRLDCIKKCLESIEIQNYRDYEIIVINDASTENMDTITHLCDHYIVNDMNLGPAYSRNLGEISSKGNILLFLDSDVILRKDTLFNLQNIFEGDNQIGAIGGSGPLNKAGDDVEFITGKSYNHFGQSKKTRYYPTNNTSRGGLYECDHLESAFLAVRREIFEKIGGFDPYWFYIGEDRDLCLSIRELGYKVVASLDTRAIHYSLNSNSFGNAKEFSRFLLKRYLQVAIKREGIWGGIRWLIGNLKAIVTHLNILSLLREFGRYTELKTRTKIDFLEKSEMDKYYSAKSSELLSDNQPFPISFPLLTPQNLVIFVTSKCNALCIHCFLSEHLNSAKWEMDKKSILKIVNSLNRKTNITLTGGEPFIRKDLKDILDKLMKSPKVASIKIPSNGFLPDRIESICSEISNKYNKSLGLQLSIDGLGKTHDNIRKVTGGFNKVIETCERAKKMKIKYPNFSFIVAITVMRQNIDEIEGLVDYLERRGYPSKLSLVRGNSLSTFNLPEDMMDRSYNPSDGCCLPKKERIENLLNNISQKHPR